MPDAPKIDKAAYKAARAKLEAIEAQRDAIAKPFQDAMHAALEPTAEAYQAAVDDVERITDGLETMGTCEFCGEPLFDDEPHGSLGEGHLTCADHAPTMSEIVEGWESAVRDEPTAWEDMFETREDFDSWVAGRKAEIAAKGDWKVTFNA